MSAWSKPAENEAVSLVRATDTELFALMAEGSLAPLGELFDRYHASVRAYAVRVVPNSSDADDVVQEAFLVASRVAGSFQASESAKPFLLGIVAQLARRKRRSFARLKARLTAFARAPFAAPRTPEEDLSSAEQASILREGIGRLSEEHREVILMVEMSGLSGVDAAKALGVPAGTVWRRLHEARSELREYVKKGAR